MFKNPSLDLEYGKMAVDSQTPGLAEFSTLREREREWKGVVLSSNGRHPLSLLFLANPT
jgi:hypothetical protein